LSTAIPIALLRIAGIIRLMTNLGPEIHHLLEGGNGCLGSKDAIVVATAGEARALAIPYPIELPKVIVDRA
jgi:hypothetical protein